MAGVDRGCEFMQRLYHHRASQEILQADRKESSDDIEPKHEPCRDSLFLARTLSQHQIDGGISKLTMEIGPSRVDIF